MKQTYWIKTAGMNSISISLSFVLALAPSLSYAQSPQTPDKTAPATEATATKKPDQPIGHTAREWALNGTAKTQQKNFEIAMAYLQKGDKENAKKYLLNGISASTLAGLLNANINDQISRETVANGKWFEAGMSSSNIATAISQAPQLTPTNTANTVAPPTTDFPGIFTTPSLPSVQPQSFNSNPLGGVTSSEDQIKRLADLMNSNPELRTLLWQTAQQRLGATAGEIGVNPPAFQSGTQPLQSSTICNQYSLLCSAVTGGGMLNVDFSQQMAELKNRHYGAPLDSLADDVISKQTIISTLLGFTFATLKNLPAQKGPVTGSWIGQTTVDISPSLALYYTNYMMLGQLAGLYNYQLNAGNKETLALVLLSLTRVYAPIIYHGTKNINPKLRAKMVAANPFVNMVARTFQWALKHNVKLDTAFGELVKKNPKNIGGALHGGLQSAAAGLMSARVAPEERSGKAGRGNILDINGNIFEPPPNGGQFPPGPNDPPPPGPEKPPEDPRSKMSVFAQIALIVASAAGNSAYNFGEAELSGIILKHIFSSAYKEDRRLESEKFRNFLYSSANTKFLKLLVLSQSPENLKLKEVVISQPSNTTNPPVLFPGGAGVPAGSQPPPGQPAKPDNKQTDNKQTNPKDENFPFMLRDEQAQTQAQTQTRRFGGDPSTFIRNVARTMHICSFKDVDKASMAVDSVKELVKTVPSLSALNEWDEIPKTTSSILNPVYKAIEVLLPFYKNPKMRENLYESLKADSIKDADAKNILLIHDCYGRSDSQRFTELLKEMISFSNFTDSDIATLRMADPFIRLRMGEMIVQLMYLNGQPDDKTKDYFEKVKKILGLDTPAYNAYYLFYQAELVKAQFVPYTLSPTGYRLRNLSAQNPYDITVMDERRPDEPQVLNPISKVAPANGGAGGWGNIGNDPFSPSMQPTIGTGFPFN